MRFLLLISAILFAFVQAALAQIPNNDLSPDKPYNSEPFLAIQPGNPQNICVAWMRANNLRIGIAVRSSHDGGLTWTDPVELPHMGRAWHSADVSMAWKSGGDLFLSYIDHRESPDSGGVFVVHSSDAGEHWSEPVLAIDAFSNADEPIDRPWIAVDRYSKSLFPKLYLVSKPPSWNPLPNHAYFTRSMNGGTTWDTLRVLDEKPYSAALIPAPMASPCVGDDGTLYIAVPTADVSQAAHIGLALATSSDGGLTFDRSMIYTPTWTSADTSLKNGYRLIANGNHLLLALSGSPNGNSDVLAISSSDRGLHWSDLVRVNDDTGTSAQDMVWPMFAKNGTAAIVWRDRRNATGDSAHVPTETYYAYSQDGGSTWSKNFRISDTSAQYIPVLSGPGNDFLSGALEQDTLYAAWADSRTGNLHVYFAKAALGGTAWIGMTDLAEAHDLLYAQTEGDGSWRIRINVAEGSSYTLSFFDVLGREVHSPLQGVSSRVHVDLPMSAAFVRISTGTASQVVKLR